MSDVFLSEVETKVSHLEKANVLLSKVQQLPNGSLKESVVADLKFFTDDPRFVTVLQELADVRGQNESNLSALHRSQNLVLGLEDTLKNLELESQETSSNEEVMDLPRKITPFRVFIFLLVMVTICYQLFS
jgi:hypothetical protein